MRCGRNAWRGVAMALGFIGTLITFIGLMASLAGANIALPGLGLVLGGPLILIIGLVVIGAAVAFDSALHEERLP